MNNLGKEERAEIALRGYELALADLHSTMGSLLRFVDQTLRHVESGEMDIAMDNWRQTRDWMKQLKNNRLVKSRRREKFESAMIELGLSDRTGSLRARLQEKINKLESK